MASRNRLSTPNSAHACDFCTSSPPGCQYPLPTVGVPYPHAHPPLVLVPLLPFSISAVDWGPGRDFLGATWHGLGASQDRNSPREGAECSLLPGLWFASLSVALLPGWSGSKDMGRSNAISCPTRGTAKPVQPTACVQCSAVHTAYSPMTAAVPPPSLAQVRLWSCPLPPHHG